MGKKGVEEMIDQIEMFIDNCRYYPLSQNKIVVHKDELDEMLRELKMKLPSEIERCKKIMRNKEAILSDARTRSDAIISESVNEANKLVDQHQITELANIRANEIIEMARNQAQQIVDDAAEEANQIRLGAMYYTKDKLSEIKDIFGKILEVERDNLRTVVESLESDTFVLENNISEMDANINLMTASSSMSYEPEKEELDSAFSEEAEGEDMAASTEEFNEPEEGEFDGDADEDEDFDDDFLDE